MTATLSSGITTKFITSSKLPLVVEPEDKKISKNEFFNLLDDQQNFLKQNLLKHGGLLLRNFPIQSVDDFAEVIKRLNTGRNFDYIGGDSPRTKIKDGIYTSTEAPPSIKIPLHNELSFVKKYPTHIYFYCETPPAERGETIIADSRKVFHDINPDVKRRFIEKKLRYVSCYYDQSALMNFINKLQPSHKSWHTVFETQDKKEVERLCRENDFHFNWNQNDWLEISQVRPAAIAHPQTHEMVWFNQAHLFDFSPKLLGWWRYLGANVLYMRKHMRLHEIFYADNTRIPRDDLYHVMDVLDANTIYFPWQKGDLLVLDNVLAMHGRATFSGKRRILTAMTGN